MVKNKMSEEIRFVKIEMKNYRQYYGTNKIEFVERDQGFTVIYGKNGEGKSNLLNAINWCLYEIEPHGIKENESNESDNLKLPIVNTKYITEINNGTKAEVKVDVWIKKGGTIYSITRILGIEKIKLETKKISTGEEQVLIYRDNKTGEILPKGCIRMPEPHSKLQVMKKESNDLDFKYLDPIKDGTAIQAIKDLLPRELSKFYLLDGEFLEHFWRNKENLRIGIEQISQLHYLSHSIKCIEKTMPKGTGISQDIDELNMKIKFQTDYLDSVDNKGQLKYDSKERVKIDHDEETSYYYLSGTPRINQLEEDRNKIRGKITQLTEELVNAGGNLQPILKENFAEKSKKLENLETELTNQRRNLIYNFVNYGPQMILKSTIENSVEMINERIALGDLPRKSKRMLAEYLIKRGRCLCEEPLGDEHKRTKHLTKFLIEMGDTEDLDELQKMAWEYKKNFLDKIDRFKEDYFIEPRKKFSQMSSEFLELDEEVAKLKEQLGIAGKSKGSKMLEDIAYLNKKLSEIDSSISETKTDNRNAEELKTKNTSARNTAFTKNTRATKVAFQTEIWERTMIIFERILNNLRTGIREEVQDNTWKNWKSLLSNNSEFKSLTISEDYSPSILDRFGFNKALNLSAGQSLLLTLAFVAAIREPTGFRFPLVIDSPAGKIDGPNTHNIGSRLPEFLPEAQITLLVTSKEYTDYISPDADYLELPKTPVCELFKEKIDVQHFKIQKEKDPENPNVGNSRIMPGKLVFVNESIDRQGWMVAIDE